MATLFGIAGIITVGTTIVLIFKKSKKKKR
jgi:hypothetical protein